MTSHPRAVVAVTAALTVAAIGIGTVLLPSSEPDPATRATAAATQRSTAKDVWAGGSAGVRNVVFWYKGSVDLATDSTAAARGAMGSPAVVVAQRGKDERATTDAIHRLGAKAYRYVQFFWSPTDRDYDGMDLSVHPDWAFCSTGDKAALGERESDGAALAFLDGNERAVRNHFRTKFRTLVAQGWDGVFIDRGEAATTYATDLDGNPVWSRISRCTEDPVKPGARFADSFVDLLGLAHQEGLAAMMNNGRPPLDPVNPMRPDSADADCRARKWSACRTLRDVWSYSDLVLAETATRPRVDHWERTFAANRAAEKHKTYGRRTVALVTATSAGGVSKKHVYYAWSRLKLFDLPAAVMTGDDRCAGSSGTVCNRYGVYPELVNVRWGKPRTTAPVSRACVKGSKVRCVWQRHYYRGINLVNAKPTAKTVDLSTQTAYCHHVWDVANQRPLAGNRCVKKVRIKLGAWAGRPLLISRKPYPST